jgi:hypothetical protein
MTLWKGPYIDGVTQSMIGKFVQCPYRFYLYAILGLAEDKPLNENLIWGDCYHKGLETLIKTKNLQQAMADTLLYRQDKYPQAPSTYDVSLTRMLLRFSLNTYGGEWETEVTFRHSYKLPSGRTIVIRGKKDAIKYQDEERTKILGEHKCKGFVDPVKTAREISQDRQVNLYCYLHDIEWVNYDLILIPESVKYKPARNFNETPQGYMERLFTGPCGNYGMFPINTNASQWVHHATYFLPREDQERYWSETLIPDMERMCEWWEYVTQPNFDHTDPKFFNHIFYKVPVRQFDPSLTNSFECDYYPYLLGEIDISELKPIPSLFQELEEL